MSGCDNFDFEAPQDEFTFMEGLRGADGTTFYPHVSADGILSWTNDGEKPNPQPVDISGPPGSSVELRGPVESVADLPVTASSSELWLVGTASPYDGWFYNGARWENAGQIAVGPPGPAGEDGVSPVIEVTGIPGGHRVTITDASGTRSIDIMDGTDGAPGAPGATPDLQIGTVATGEPGSAAKATITGTPTEPRLNLKLPRGQQGPAVPLSDDTPQMDDTASPGTGTSAARADHVHPHDTSKQDTITASGILKGNGSGKVSAAVAGTDYLTPATNYSPLSRVAGGTVRVLTSADVGKTFWEQWTSTIQNEYITYELTEENSVNMPLGTEIAFLTIFSKEVRIKFTNIRAFHSELGFFNGGNGHTITVKAAPYNLVAMKKIDKTYGTSTDCWLLTGNVEVVS